jgi:hypothetical protein
MQDSVSRLTKTKFQLSNIQGTLQIKRDAKSFLQLTHITLISFTNTKKKPSRWTRCWHITSQTKFSRVKKRAWPSKHSTNHQPCPFSSRSFKLQRNYFCRLMHLGHLCKLEIVQLFTHTDNTQLLTNGSYKLLLFAFKYQWAIARPSVTRPSLQACKIGPMMLEVKHNRWQICDA